MNPGNTVIDGSQKKSSEPQKKKLLWIFTGSIACFKATAALSKIVQDNFEVQVVATEAALKFIGKATLEGLTGKKVLCDTFEEGSMMDHIHAARWADAILVAPATANFINKISNGVADDLASTIFLAHDFTKPFLVAPAMNSAMYSHPVTRESCDKLKKFGLKFIEPEEGHLACGEIGSGRLAEADQIVEFVKSAFIEKTQRPLKILVTGGGTIEPIDDVRAITNTSSGKTAATIVSTLERMGHDVTAVFSQNSPRVLSRTVRYKTFGDLYNVLETELTQNKYDVVVHAAAVSDYSVDFIESETLSATTGSNKISSGQNLNIHLKPNAKIVNEIKKWAPNSRLVAFKMTSQATDKEILQAVEKLLKASQADLVVHNDVQNISNQKHQANFFDSHAEKIFSVEQKNDLALTLANKIETFFSKETL